MKKLKAGAFGALLSLCCIHAIAQDAKVPLNEPDRNKPSLFADLPEKMDLRLNDMEKLFQPAMGSRVSVQVSDQFIFEGTMVSRADATDASSHSVVFRSTNRPGATLTFTRTTSADGKMIYIGRIMSMHNGDAFVIRSEDGHYILQKKELYDLISE